MRAIIADPMPVPETTQFAALVVPANFLSELYFKAYYLTKNSLECHSKITPCHISFEFFTMLKSEKFYTNN